MSRTCQLSDVTKQYLHTYREIVNQMVERMGRTAVNASISENCLCQLRIHQETGICLCRNLLQYTICIPVQEVAIRMEQEQQERIEDMDRMWDHCSTYRNIISDQQAFRCRQCQITSRIFCQMRQIPAENQINTLFLKEMIPHHRGAVDLCQATLHFPVCRDLKRFLYSMITSQEQELRTMQQMLRCMESRTFF